jgi:predicted aspartyl protease
VTQSYSGSSHYLADHQVGPLQLLVAVACFIGHSPERFYGLLDTAATWCVLPPRLADELGYRFEPSAAPVRMLTRLGDYNGSLERITLRFDAEDGMWTEIDATWFVSADWLGPLVIGWKGALERIRFGLDPATETFYFASL